MAGYFDSYENIIVDEDDILHMCKEVPTEYGYSKLVNKKNEVAILYSPGFGAGWSSWTVQYALQLATDSRIIKYRFNLDQFYHNIDIETFIKQINCFELMPYVGDFKKTRIKFIPEGTMFRINEYDGAETIEIYSPDNYMKA